MYPSIDPYKTEMLPVGDGHVLYVEQCGNPAGIPAVFIHGGPGGGSHPDMRRFFDPERYRIVVYDQRACGQSTPFGTVENVTPDILVDDLDRIRAHLGGDQWVIAASSWGSALSLKYAIKYPERVRGMTISGVFFMDRRGVEWFTEEGGASNIRPEWFGAYRDLIPPDKRKGGLTEAYCDLMETGADEEIREAARRFDAWDTSILYFEPNLERISEVEAGLEKSIPLTKNFFYFVRHYYRDENRAQILDGVKNLGHIPCFIVHGRYDLICPVKNAFDLHEVYPGSTLFVMDKTGHTARDPNIANKMAEITDKLAEDFSK
ncbi:MAG: prolyl aminopeptidase [Rhodospirillales bacterium]|nr:prolyl aminopeptidase [Rhodospirillales bacterium]